MGKEITVQWRIWQFSNKSGEENGLWKLEYVVTEASVGG